MSDPAQIASLCSAPPLLRASEATAEKNWRFADCSHFKSPLQSRWILDRVCEDFGVDPLGVVPFHTCQETLSEKLNSKQLAPRLTYGWLERDRLELMLLLLSRFSRVRLCVTRQTAAQQAPVPGILQARTLEWVAISFSNARK